MNKTAQPSQKLISDTAIIIPAYNEGKVIRSVLNNAIKQFKHIVVVNDGSRDNTSSEAKSTSAIVIDHFINGGGQGGALQTGIDYALTLPVDYFVTYDADGQHRIEDVIAMRETIIKEKADIVIGSRFLGLESINMPKSKRAMLKAAIAFSNLTSGLKLTDTHNGLRIFNRHVAETLNIEEVGFQHASEITEKIAKNKYKYREQPIQVIYSEYSRGKGQSMLNAINIAGDVILGKVTGK